MNKFLLLSASAILPALCAFAQTSEPESVLLQGTPISSAANGAHTADMLFDDDPSTYFQAATYRATGTGEWTTQYTWAGLELAEPHVITKICWIAGSANADVNLGMFQGANREDFLDAVPLQIIKSSSQTIPSALKQAAVDCSRGFKYLRYVGPEGSACRMAELQFYGYPSEGDDSRLWQITAIPTVCINTNDGVAPYDKENEIKGQITIISENGTDILSEPGGVRERGNASRTFPKKPWRIKFDKKQRVLNSPAKAKKWTLINNYGDKTLMRNRLAFDIARAFEMDYVPFCEFVDVVLNGEYKGCYQLCDQIEVNANRVNITEIEETDDPEEALTGGYFVEVDAYASEEPWGTWFTTDHYYLPVTVKSPDEELLTSERLDYITDYFNTLESMLKNTDPDTGYRSRFDVSSFVKHMLTNELAGNTDTYWSTYMYKDRNSDIIYTGPVWDFDLGFNNDGRTYPIETRVPKSKYLWDSGLGSAAGNMRYFAQRVFLKDNATATDISHIWSYARNVCGLSADWLVSLVDEYAELLDDSQKLNFMRWPILSEYVHQNPRVAGTYAGECDYVRDYIRAIFPKLDTITNYDENYFGDHSGIDATDLEPTKYGVWRAYRPDGTLAGAGSGKPQLTPGLYIIIHEDSAEKIIIR